MRTQFQLNPFGECLQLLATAKAAGRLDDDGERAAVTAIDALAKRWLERSLAACGPPALFSEEFDVAQRQLRGNTPQAFVHALALETGVRMPGLVGLGG